MADSPPDTPTTTPSTPACDCCPVDPRIAAHFDKATQERMVDGALPPMQPISERLFEKLADVAELRPTVLELGCGSGALSVALARDGATRVHGVDLSVGSVAAARRRAAEAGVGERASFEVGDGATTPLEAYDWVVLDRVICCYAHVDALFGNALAAARARFAFTVPESRGWRGVVARVVILVENLTRPFRPVSCPAYLHDVRKLESRLAAAGFRLRSATRRYWYTAVWDRA